jgi:hypothetical protein
MASKKLSLTVVCLIVAIGMIAGCGSDTANPVAPEDTAPPALPAGLNVEYTPYQQFVTVSWAPNVTDPDLAGYLIYRASYDQAPIPLVTVPQASTVFEDTSLAGAGRLLTYYVRAVDTRNNVSAAATISVTLEEPVDSSEPNPAKQ